MSARAESAGRTGERILDAMLARFAGSPYERIRLDDVAADAEVTVQTVIRRFGGKSGLMVAVVERELARIVEAREVAGQAPPASVLAALVQHYERSGALILKMYSEVSLVPGLPEIAARGRAYHVDWCRRVFADRLPRDEQLRQRRLAQVVAVCDATTWRILREDGALTPPEVELALAELLDPVLDPLA
ncbi:transcriptional regulator, TetR family [Agromyces sp. CF514]|uniref:TetR/AcrR family transcriptional regulator n=1 Tax=Agromyces sp. CF514 TaxID=1881031 RepID=UPI0008E06AFD|nr:TetR/AcrR family transcriptional regulator [Agromyces sp. CF514]SFR90476.1 transcriptional regulator, TetR family [Agromyces sp. CF514]